jgi:nitroimidazol reductase NimA-like FMN-containing flavoprotein (pyridoxamine 5'-phosphate oxidase superfamily)
MRSVRDSNKQITCDEAMHLLTQGEYGVLSTVDRDGQPYGVPLNYVVLDDAIYVHCALVGHKLENIADNHNVCFTVVGTSQIVASAFTAAYESVVVFGTASLAAESEKVNMLQQLIRKYSAGFEEKGQKVIEAFKDKCAVVRIDIRHITGVRKK